MPGRGSVSVSVPIPSESVSVPAITSKNANGLDATYFHVENTQ